MNNELYHHGIKGQKWGVRRYQYADGSLTSAGKNRQQRRLDAGQRLYESGKTIGTFKKQKAAAIAANIAFQAVATMRLGVIGSIPIKIGSVLVTAALSAYGDVQVQSLIAYERANLSKK